MKNNKIKNLKVVGASLCLGAVLLTGCGDSYNIRYGSSYITYHKDSEEIEGTISYENLVNLARICSFQQEDEKFYRLCAMSSRRYATSYFIQYYDMKTGNCIIDYQETDGEKVYTIGEDLEIVEEINLDSYLLKENFVKKEYTVDELLHFYEEKILPTLEEENKELVK